MNKTTAAFYRTILLVSILCITMTACSEKKSFDTRDPRTHNYYGFTLQDNLSEIKTKLGSLDYSYTIHEDKFGLTRIKQDEKSLVKQIDRTGIGDSPYAFKIYKNKISFMCLGLKSSDILDMFLNTKKYSPVKSETETAHSYTWKIDGFSYQFTQYKKNNLVTYWIHNIKLEQEYWDTVVKAARKQKKK